jgi:outer membrane protein assembly factor BamD
MVLHERRVTMSTTQRARGWRGTAAAVVLAGLAGCGIFGQGQVDRTAKMTPQEIYAESKDEMAAGRYGEAAKLLTRLEARYPFGLYAQQAQLDTAYAFYKDGDRTQALIAVERFMRLYPTSNQLDYALYLKGLINFNDEQGIIARWGGQDLSERDLKAARESFEAFRQLVTRFPESRYAEDARLRMRYLVNAMAGGEVHIARYYFNRGAYLAAVNRAQGVVQQYQGAPAVEEALYIMMKGYEKLGLEELRADAERVLRLNFPQSELFAKGIRLDDRSWWQVWR